MDKNTIVFDETLQIQGKLLFQFDSFSQWVNKATRLFKPYTHVNTICLDKNNNQCFIGEDFMRAEKEGLYPVKVYQIKRTVNG